MKKKTIIVIAVFAIFLSCAPTAKFLAPEFKKPQYIAILPTINQTTDVKGGTVFRNLVYVKMEQIKYAELLPLNVVDSLLNEEGITDGGQLSTISNDDLFHILNVDGLMYVELLQCNYQSLGISEKRQVRANMKLILYPGKNIWEDEREVKTGKSALGSAFSALTNPTGFLKEQAQDFGKQMLIKGLKMLLLDHELRAEMEQTIALCTNTLPRKAPTHSHMNLAKRERNKSEPKAGGLDALLTPGNNIEQTTLASSGTEPKDQDLIAIEALLSDAGYTENSPSSSADQSVQNSGGSDLDMLLAGTGGQSASSADLSGNAGNTAINTRTPQNQALSDNVSRTPAANPHSSNIYTAGTSNSTQNTAANTGYISNSTSSGYNVQSTSGNQSYTSSEQQYAANSNNHSSMTFGAATAGSYSGSSSYSTTQPRSNGRSLYDRVVNPLPSEMVNRSNRTDTQDRYNGQQNQYYIVIGCVLDIISARNTANEYQGRINGQQINFLKAQMWDMECINIGIGPFSSKNQAGEILQQLYGSIPSDAYVHYYQVY